MRLAVLHTRLSSYFLACLKRFAERHAVDLSIHVWPPHRDAPFDFGDLDLPGEVFTQDDEILERVTAFRPDAVLTCGWVDKRYTAICKKLRTRSIPVIAGCDTQYTGSWRQWLGKLSASVHLHRAIDVIWAAGTRQKRLASFLGYPPERIWEGYYSCDWERFAEKAESRRHETGEDKPQIFLYVGRYVPDKGLDVLANAYSIYRSKVERPWRLVCAGTGPQRDLLTQAGAEDRGFVQPKQLTGLMGEGTVFILPSRFEPWGVVVHEAAAAGLPLICSSACGAADLFRDDENGFLVVPGSSDALASRMLAFHHMNKTKLAEFSLRSLELSRQITLDTWADTLHDGVLGLRRRR